VFTCDAQCLLALLLESDRSAELPEHWCHGPHGSLTYRFSGGTNSYTWDARAVEETAARWRGLEAPRPDSVARFIAAHESLLAGLGRIGGALPDSIYHDLGAGEVTAVWQDRKQVVIIDAIGEGDPAVGAASVG
jgi:hypothetical protein